VDAVTLLKDQVKQAHEICQGTVADLTAEQAHWKPGGTANSCAPLLVHIASAEDMFLNMFTGRQPLAMGPYAGKTGASEPHPAGRDYGEWAGRVTVDMPQFSEYVKAVFKNTEDYVAGLSDADLDKEIDLSAAGIGKMSLGAFITMTCVIHPSNHTGEISVMKGMQGGKGYPF
jgi:uncharacterized damage-inducible protein DinB